MGGRRIDDDSTRADLIAAAERILVTQGPDALSVRAVAAEAGTTTQSVYTLFKSKAGLVNALALRLYELVEEVIVTTPETDDPAEDLAEIAVGAIRTFAHEHSALYRIGFQRVGGELEESPEVVAARARGRERFASRLRRLEEAGMLRSRTAEEATVEYNALLDGFVNLSLRGATFLVVPRGSEEDTWRRGVWSLVAGWAASPPSASRR